MCTGRQAFNALVQINSVLQFIYWASIYLLKVTDENIRWKHQMKVWNLLKVNNKDTRIMSMTLIWYLYCWFQAHFTSCSCVFSVSIVVFEQVKSWVGSRSHHTKKKGDISFLLFIKNIYCSQRQIQNLWHI